MKLAIIIPCYNEEANIVKVVEECNTLSIPNVSVEPIVINDCSTDNSLKILKEHRISHISLPVNLGIGGAMQTGFKYAYRNGFDIAVQIDGDGQHPPLEIARLVQPILKGELDVVIGSRFIEKKGFQSTVSRRWGIRILEKWCYFLSGIRVKDITSGFRLLNRKALQIVERDYPDTYPEPETIVLYGLNHLKIGEIPVEMRARDGGKSSITSSHSIYYMVKVALGMFFMTIKVKRYGKHSSL
jgi:glycosyltransferase involved in cell wall biosynthesis